MLYTNEEIKDIIIETMATMDEGAVYEFVFSLGYDRYMEYVEWFVVEHYELPINRAEVRAIMIAEWVLAEEKVLD